MKKLSPRGPRPVFSIALTLWVLLLRSTTPGAQIYNLGSDWSNTQNPNGVWSYNHNASPISVFQNFSIGRAGWGYNFLADGSILKGDPLAGSFDWQPGDVMMHALSLPYGGASTFLNVTWTSPADGIIDISGRAWDGAIDSDRDVAWFLIVGGEIIAQRSSVIGLHRGDSGAQFGSNLNGSYSLNGILVTQGEVVEFRVVTDTFYGHFVGIEEIITLVPEAGTGSLLAVGAMVMGVFRRFSPRVRGATGSNSRL